MAIAFVGQRGIHNASGWGTTEPIDLPTGASISTGNTLIMMIATDNSATGGTLLEISVTDPKRNVWTRLSRTLNDPGIENEGIQLEVWTTFVQDPYSNGSDVTLTMSEPVLRGCVIIVEFSGVKPLNYSVVTPISSTGSSTSAGPGTITPVASGQLVIGLAGVETNSTMTGDGDSTGGSWSTIVQDISDSGSPASSVSLAYQYKIVSSTATQDWDVTWSSSADWCAIAVVMDVFSPASDPTVNGNPDYPCISGFEGLSIGSALVPVDTGTQYLFEHQVFPNADDIGDYSCGVEFEVPFEESLHHVIFELYSGTADKMFMDSEITTYRSTVLSGSTDGTITGGATFVDALSSPGGNQIVLDEGQQASITFNGPVALIGKRIVRVGVRYIAWKDDSSPSTPSEGVNVFWCDNLYTPFGVPSCANMGAWLTLDYQSNAVPVTRWLGEVNYLPVGGYDPLDNNPPAMPFKAVDITRMASSGITFIKFVAMRGDDPDAPATDTIWLDYAELVVETVVERRLGASVRTVGTFINASVVNTAGVNVGSFGREDGVILKDALSTSGAPAIVPASTPLILGIREALPATGSDYYRNLTSDHRMSDAEAIGPSLLTKGIVVPRDTLNPRPDVFRGSISGGVLTGPPTDLDQYILSVSGFPQSSYMLYGSFWPGYSDFEERLLSGSSTTSQYVLVNGSTQFDRIKVVVKPDPGLTHSLSISVEKPVSTVLATATITLANALAGLSLGNGYYEVSVPLSGAITPSAGQVFIKFSTTSPYPISWWLSRAVPYGIDPSFGYNLSNPDVSIRDYSVVLQCALSNPSVAVVDKTIVVARPSCGNSSSITHPQIQISPVNVFDRYVIYRSITAGHTDAVSIAVIDSSNIQIDPTNTFYMWDDYGVPWDVSTVYYRVYGYRDADRRVFLSSWTSWSGAPATSPGPAFGLSDQQSGTVVAFDPIDPSDVSIVWKSLNPIEQIQLHGLDYSIALRSPEERGLSITVPILIDNMYTCNSTPITQYAEPIVPGAKSMTPSPYDVLRSLEGFNRLALQLPGGHTRWVSLDLGDMTIRVAGAVYVAEITLTDVVHPPSDPYSGRY